MITTRLKDTQTYANIPEQQTATDGNSRQQTATGDNRPKQTATDDNRRQQAARDGNRRQQTATDANRRQLTATDGNRRTQTSTDDNRRQQAATDGSRQQQTSTDCNRRHQTAVEGNRRQQTGTDGTRRQQTATSQWFPRRTGVFRSLSNQVYGDTRNYELQLFENWRIPFVFCKFWKKLCLHCLWLNLVIVALVLCVPVCILRALLVFARVCLFRTSQGSAFSVACQIRFLRTDELCWFSFVFQSSWIS